MRHSQSNSEVDGIPPDDLKVALHRSEENLERELRFTALVGEMFGRLTNPAGESANNEIGQILGPIQSFAGVDQSSLLLFAADGKQVRITQSHPLDGTVWLPEVVEGELPWYMDRLRRGRIVRWERALDLPAEAAAEREMAAKGGVKSHLCLPLTVHGAVLGGIALTCFDSERTWPDELIEKLAVIGKILSTLVTLNSMETKLRRSVGELTQARDGLQAQSELAYERIRVIDPVVKIVGHSDGIKDAMEKVRQVAGTQSTVLILGETGTGKELIARAIHDQSSRRARPMVKVNCAALPSALVESELFGRERGAYTGALSKQIGRFELADESTLFLDEIGDLPLELQGKLLRVLQEGEFERLGSPRTVRVNTRVLAATNRDLARGVSEGTFREDLFYRLNMFTIAMPPLREHPLDIPSLVWTFVRQFEESMAKVIESVPQTTMEALRNCPWPGNVRQLRNVIEHAMIITTGATLKVHVPKLEKALIKMDEGMTMSEVQRKHILEVLELSQWRVSGNRGAAKILGMRPTTLESRMQKLGIHRRDAVAKSR